MNALRFRSHILMSVLLCTLVILLAGCANPDAPLSDLKYKATKMVYGTGHDEVASTHISVLSVARWDDYKKELQPTFELTEKEALKQAVADTLRLDRSALDAFAASFGLKLAPSHVLAEGFQDEPYAGTNIPEPNASDARAGTSVSLDPNSIGIDPHLAYQAATALYQEVKLLNRYVTDAAIAEGYKAYVVQTQIACMPKQRGLPYDTYVNLGFFLQDVRIPGEDIKAFIGDYRHSSDELRVLPLLATDQIEAALMSRRADRLRQISLALSAAYAGIGGNTNIDRLTNIIDSSLGRNYNSLFTVGRISCNAMRVRLGARQSPGGHNYEMVPQTHKVSVLLLVPDSKVNEDTESIYLGSRTRFAYCRNGRPVPYNRLSRLDKKWLLSSWKTGTSQQTQKVLDTIISNEDHWSTLTTYASNDEYLVFVAFLKSNKIDDQGLVNRMWFDLSTWISNEYDKAIFTVPKYPDPDPGFLDDNQSQTVVLADNGKTTSATIVGVKDIEAEKASSLWHFKDKKTRDNYTFAATEIKLDPEGRNLTLTFPSAVAAELIPDNTTHCGLALSHRKDNGPSQSLGTLEWRYARTSTAKQKSQITVEVVQEALQASITDSNGVEAKRYLVVGFARSPGVDKKTSIEDYKMSISGAVVTPCCSSESKTTIKAISDKVQVYEIKELRPVTFELGGLVSGHSVKLSFSAPAGFESPPAKEIKVEPAACAK